MRVKKLATLFVTGLLVAGCSGGETETVKAAPTIQLADACQKVQDALDAAFKGKEGGPFWDSETYQGLADAIDDLTKRVDPKGVPLLTRLAEATHGSAKNANDANAIPEENLEAERNWLRVMQQVTDTCQQLGAPLS